MKLIIKAIFLSCLFFFSASFQAKEKYKSYIYSKSGNRFALENFVENILLKDKSLSANELGELVKYLIEAQRVENDLILRFIINKLYFSGFYLNSSYAFTNVEILLDKVSTQEALKDLMVNVFYNNSYQEYQNEKMLKNSKIILKALDKIEEPRTLYYGLEYYRELFKNEWNYDSGEGVIYNKKIESFLKKLVDNSKTSEDLLFFLEEILLERTLKEIQYSRIQSFIESAVKKIIEIGSEDDLYLLKSNIENQPIWRKITKREKFLQDIEAKTQENYDLKKAKLMSCFSFLKGILK